MIRNAADTRETRELPMLTRTASFEPSTFDAEKRTVELVWTTGAKGLRRSYWDGDYFEELEVSDSAVRMGRLNNGAPLLAAHDSYSLDAVIGVVERAWLANGEGRSVVRFSEREELQGIVKDVQSGVLRNISVGYTVHRYEVTKAADSKIDTYRAVDWEPMEISIVPIGFDDGAKVRSAEKKTQVEIFTRGAAAPAETEVIQMNEEEKKAAAEAAAKQRQVELEASAETARAEAAKAEKARANEIRLAVRKAGLPEEFAQKLVDGDTKIEKAREMIIDAMAEKQTTEQGTTRSHHIEAGADARDKFRQGACAWIIQKANVRNLFGADGQKMDAGEFRGLTMVDLARHALQLEGFDVRGLSRLDLVGRAFTHRGAYNGTNEFAVLLETAMHKVLLAGYNTQPDTWSRFCHVGSVSDFRVHNRYRLGTFGALDAVNEHGEFKNKQIPDGAKESISVTTKGNIIGLSRQAMINDDMGVFNSLATGFGRAAKLSVEVDVYAALALNSGMGPALNDGNPIFYASRVQGTNIGTGAALSAASLDADAQVMALQKDIGGNEFLSLSPSVLLLPRSLSGQAQIINKSEFDPDTVANKAQQKPNIARGIVNDIIGTPRLTGTRRYLFADPNVAPVLEVAFLDGNQEPFLDQQNGWRTDGTEWKVRLDYGVGGVGCEGAVTNAGV